MHRFTWDLHYQPLDGGPSTSSGQAARLGGPTLPIASIPYNTVPSPTTPWVNPGQYTVKLTVNGKAHSQTMTVKQDPRVKTPPLTMQEIYTQSKAMYYGALNAQAAAREAQKVRDQLANLKPRVTGGAVQVLADLEAKINAIEGAPFADGGAFGGGGRGRGAGAPPAPPDTLTGASATLAGVMNILQGADVKPTTVQTTAIANARAAATRAMTRWSAIKTTDLVAFNARMKAAGLSTVTP